MKIVMKLHRSYIIIAAIFVLLLCAVGGCAKDPLKPVNIELLDSSLAFAGAEAVYLMQTFKVTNPNEDAVSADLSYVLYLKDQVVGSSSVPKFYVPGKKEVTIKDTIAVAYLTWFAQYLLGKAETGGSAAAAINYITPLWKGISGKRPVVVTEDVWNKIEVADPAVMADVSATTTYVDSAETKFTRLELKVQSR